ncbi:hypothetical protein JI666_13815 [Bacillus sp. NTK071]|uniref:hypothetical protein n=1 Tax=Bacillus sp. NTK071 TaxID=2802175 RepID=UPI001A8F09AC|nr:hypothetical protein [Bacillus sp. NTK071]MBN8209829.1 hypothetical protein [Bacillus sp. NTK071]
MDIEKLVQLLKSQYTVNVEKKSELLLIIYPKNKDGTTNLDMGFKLVSVGHAFYLYELQRNQEYKLAQFNNEQMGLLGLYTALEGTYGDIKVEESIKNKLRNIDKDVQQAITILNEKVSNHLFSILAEKRGAINVTLNDSKYDIYYLSLLDEKVIISESRPFSSALVVTYNFSKKLETFDEFINALEFDFIPSISDIEQLKRLFIGK